MSWRVDIGCPHCGRYIKDAEEELDLEEGVDGTYTADFDCPECERGIHVEIDVEFDISYTLKSVSTEEDWVNYSHREVVKFMARKPAEVTARKMVCEHCGTKYTFDEAKTAAMLMQAGWRVEPEYPGLRGVCPKCRGKEEAVG